MHGRTDGQKEGRKAKNYVPPLFFEKTGDNKADRQYYTLDKIFSLSIYFLQIINMKTLFISRNIQTCRRQKDT